MQKKILLPDKRNLTYAFSTTHKDRRYSAHSNLYVSRIWYNRSDGSAYTIMAHQQNHRPFASQTIWGIYRVEEWPHNFYYPEGNYTLLKGPMIRREALCCLMEVIRDDPGHQHSYWTTEDIIQRYQDKTSQCLTAFCKTCSNWIYNEKVEYLISSKAIEILPTDWYKRKDK